MLADDGCDELAAGPPVLDSEIGVEVAARRTIAPDKLPAPLSARRGASVRLYGTSDLVCRARLGEPFLLRRLVPHFGAVQAWRGDPALGDRATPATPDEVARDTWDEATERTLLVAALDDVRGDCSGALWARSDELPDPTLFAPQPVPGELRARLERSVRALPAYRALAKRYAESQSAGSDANAQPPHWERFGGAEPALRAFGNDERQFVTFAASAGGCGDFSGRLWALFEVRGPALGLLNHPGRDDEPAEFVIDAIVDADGDGRIELLAPSVMLRATRGPTVVRDVTPPFHDCGC